MIRRPWNGHLREFSGGGRLDELPRDDVGERCRGCVDRVSNCIGDAEEDAAWCGRLGDELRGEFERRVIDCGVAETWIWRSAAQKIAVREVPMDDDQGFRKNRRVLGRYQVHGQRLKRNVQIFHGLGRGDTGSAAQS